MRAPRRLASNRFDPHPRRSSFACDSIRPGSSPRPAATACEANLAGPVNLAFEVWNLGDRPPTARITLTLDPPGVPSRQPERMVNLAARSSSLAAWTIDAGSMFASEGRLTAHLTAR